MYNSGIVAIYEKRKTHLREPKMITTGESWNEQLVKKVK